MIACYRRREDAERTVSEIAVEPRYKGGVCNGAVARPIGVLDFTKDRWDSVPYASSDGMKSSHLSPSFMSCMASVQPLMTWFGAKVAGRPVIGVVI